MVSNNTIVLRQVDTDAGRTTLQAQDASVWTNEGGVKLYHTAHWRGHAPRIEEVYLSPQEMDLLFAWWSQQQEKKS